MTSSKLEKHADQLAALGRARRFIHYRASYVALRGLTDYLWEDCCKGGGDGKCC